MYRFPRSLALDFLNGLNLHMNGDTCPDIPKTFQFCSVLNFYASGSYQRRVGSDAFVIISVWLVSRCVRAYNYVIATKIMDQFIQFPETVASTTYVISWSFCISWWFPHCSCSSQSSDRTCSYESKTISRSEYTIWFIGMRFLSVNARYPGSTHDSLIWRASLVNSHLRRLCNRMGSDWSYFTLVDQGYPLQPWLLKPYDSSETEAQKLYNKNHRKLRSLIEKAIGLLKARFRCLLGENKLRYDPLMSGYIMLAQSFTIIYSITTTIELMISLILMKVNEMKWNNSVLNKVHYSKRVLSRK